MVDAELMKWKSGPWQAEDFPSTELPPWPVVERLQPILGEEIRAASRTYSWRTGLSVDQMHPKHLGLLSDEALHATAFF